MEMCSLPTLIDILLGQYTRITLLHIVLGRCDGTALQTFLLLIHSSAAIKIFRGTRKICLRETLDELSTGRAQISLISRLIECPLKTTSVHDEQNARKFRN